MPSVKVKYLWDKIFTEFGYTYSGSVFDTFDFNNLWMTYPKGILSTVPDIELYDSNDLEFERTNPAFVDPENVQFKQSSYLFQNSNTTNDLQQIFNFNDTYPNSCIYSSLNLLNPGKLPVSKIFIFK